MFSIFAMIIIVLIALVLGYAATRPDTFSLSRSALIAAPPEKIFPLINDFRKWTAWSPWEVKDPAMARLYGEITSGKGARYGWEGNKAVGKGSMEITDAVPSSRIIVKLDFISPFEAHNTAGFTLTPQGGSTQVNWTMQGPVPYMMKIVQLFFSMDKMVGKDFETGLANLKAAAEKALG